MRVSFEFPQKFPGPTRSFLFSVWKLSTVKIGNLSRNHLKTQSVHGFLRVETVLESFLVRKLGVSSKVSSVEATCLSR